MNREGLFSRVKEFMQSDFIELNNKKVIVMLNLDEFDESL